MTKVTSVKGGVVHLGNGAAMPQCGAGKTGSFEGTEAELSCKRCLKIEESMKRHYHSGDCTELCEVHSQQDREYKVIAEMVITPEVEAALQATAQDMRQRHAAQEIEDLRMRLAAEIDSGDATLTPQEHAMVRDAAVHEPLTPGIAAMRQALLALPVAQEGSTCVLCTVNPVRPGGEMLCAGCARQVAAQPIAEDTREKILAVCGVEADPAARWPRPRSVPTWRGKHKCSKSQRRRVPARR